MGGGGFIGCLDVTRHNKPVLQHYEAVRDVDMYCIPTLRDVFTLAVPVTFSEINLYASGNSIKFGTSS